MLDAKIKEVKIKRTDFPAQIRNEGEVIPEGFSKTPYTPGVGRRHFNFRQGNKFYHFCIDYDGDIKEIVLEEKV